MEAPRLDPTELAAMITEAANGATAPRADLAILDLVDRVGADARARITRATDTREAILEWAVRCETYDDALTLADAREVLAWIYNVQTGLATPHAPLDVATATVLDPPKKGDEL